MKFLATLALLAGASAVSVHQVGNHQIRHAPRVNAKLHSAIKSRLHAKLHSKLHAKAKWEDLTEEQEQEIE